MELDITFPGGMRVDAHFGNFIVETDQEGSAPAPFALFLASIGTCAGYYVLEFCQKRGIPTEGIRIVQRTHTDRASGMVSQITLDIQLPPDFPEKYSASIIRAAELCKVKKHLEKPPAFNVFTTITQTISA
jgi:ribosomal protein S12 methylthiotransferase accessory factor